MQLRLIVAGLALATAGNVYAQTAGGLPALKEELIVEMERAKLVEKELDFKLLLEETDRKKIDTTHADKLLIYELEFLKEVERAKAAEHGLRGEFTLRLDAEASGRAAADATLQSNINAEAAARAAADTTLQNNVNAEAAARSAADATLQSNVTAEAAARTAADTTLQSGITAEASAREQADTELANVTTAQIAAEASARQGADTQLRTDFAAETAARRQGDMDTLAASKAHTDTSVNASANNEAAARIASANNEAAARIAADTTLQNNIAAEAAARAAADTTLQNNVDAEAAARAAADTTLQSNVDAEAAARQAADADLLGKINAIPANRGAFVWKDALTGAVVGEVIPDQYYYGWDMRPVWRNGRAMVVRYKGWVAGNDLFQENNALIGGWPIGEYFESADCSGAPLVIDWHWVGFGGEAVVLQNGDQLYHVGRYVGALTLRSHLAHVYPGSTGKACYPVSGSARAWELAPLALPLESVTMPLTLARQE